MKKAHIRIMHHKITRTARCGQLIAICVMLSFVISCLEDEDRCPEGMVLVKKDASADDGNWFDVCIIPIRTDTGTGTGSSGDVDTGSDTQSSATDVDTDTGTDTSATDTGTDTSDLDTGTGTDTSATDTGTDTSDPDTGTGMDTSATDTGTGTETAACTVTSCNAGEYCDLTMVPPTCLLPPTGQGESCGTSADCAGFEANWCEVAITKTCLRQNCDLVANNCSAGYMCCDFSWTNPPLPPTCVSQLVWGLECYVP